MWSFRAVCQGENGLRKGKNSKWRRLRKTASPHNHPSCGILAWLGGTRAVDQQCDSERVSGDPEEGSHVSVSRPFSVFPFLESRFPDSWAPEKCDEGVAVAAWFARGVSEETEGNGVLFVFSPGLNLRDSLPGVFARGCVQGRTLDLDLPELQTVLCAMCM